MSVFVFFATGILAVILGAVVTLSDNIFVRSVCVTLLIIVSHYAGLAGGTIQRY